MRTDCPYCQGKVVQTRNRDGPNFCPHCRQLFDLPEEQKVPAWVYGALMFLIVNLQYLTINVH